MEIRIAIDCQDFFSIVAVWEVRNERWMLVRLARLNQAIALCHRPNQFVFPASTNPNTLRRKSRGAGTKIEPSIQDSGVREPEKLSRNAPNTITQVFRLIEACPGQSRQELARRLEVNPETLKVHLRQLERQGQIYYQRHPKDNKIKLYYRNPTFQGTSVKVNSNRIAMCPLCRE